MSEGVFINDPEIIDFFKTNTDLNIIIEIKRIIRLHKKHKTTKHVTSDEIVSFNTDFETFFDEIAKLKKSYHTHFSKYINEKNPDFKCDICNRFFSINLKGLLIHKRSCLQRMNNRNLPYHRRPPTNTIEENKESLKNNNSPENNDVDQCEECENDNEGEEIIEVYNTTK